MNIEAGKKKISEALQHIEDESIIKEILDLLSIDTSAHKIVGYTANGIPITYEELGERMKKSSQDVKNGDYLTQEEMEQSI